MGILPSDKQIDYYSSRQYVHPGGLVPTTEVLPRMEKDVKAICNFFGIEPGNTHYSCYRAGCEYERERIKEKST